MNVTGADVPASEVEGALTRLVRIAREGLSVRYAALAILDQDRLEVECFVTAGIDESTREAIGAHPRGRGVLGQLLLDPQPLRIEDLASDPSSYGFPHAHPEMHSFLGVPILIDGQPSGNLYFADEPEHNFTDVDEHAATTLALAAAIAVECIRSQPSRPP